MPLEVIRTSSATEAARVLASNRAAYVLGGGTGLMRRVHEGDARVGQLIRVSDLSLGQISRLGSDLRIGAQVTMAEILASPDAQVLHAAAASVGAPALRNMATVGGNLFARPPYGDLTVALLGAGAEVETASASGVDRRPLDAALMDQARRVVIAVVLPDPGHPVLYHKMSRNHPRGASIVTLAVSLPGRGQPRVAVGGLAGRPCRAPGAERALGSGPLTAARIEEAARRITDGLTAHTDALASGWYREKMAAVQLRRLLSEAL